MRTHTHTGCEVGDRARCRCPRATTSSLSLVSATVARTVLSTDVTIGKEQVRGFLVAAYALSWFIVMVSDHSHGPFSWFIMKLRDMSFWFPVIVFSSCISFAHRSRRWPRDRASASKRERDETDDFLRPTHHPLACHVGTQAGTYAWIGSGVRGLRSTGRIRQGMLSLCIVGGCGIRQVPTRSALSRTRPTELRQLRLRGEIRVNETWFRHIASTDGTRDSLVCRIPHCVRAHSSVGG